MLTKADESLLHQAPLTFSQTVTSDHRFYDRFFMITGDPSGNATLVLSMGVYKNMNVVDGFGLFTRGSRQENVRVSRPLRPTFETEVHGLRYEILEPMRRIRVSLSGDHPLKFDLEWNGLLPPMLESRWWGTTNVVMERQAIDVQRYEQAGKLNGWIECRGERVAVKDWFGGRDHSWGVRGGVGGFEPNNGGQLLNSKGMLLTWFLFSVGDTCGYIARTEDDMGVQQALDGAIQTTAAPGKEIRITDAKIDVSFPHGSRYYKKATMDFTTEDGKQYHLEATPYARTPILRGGGYDGGWNDAKGLGAYRGNLIEHDAFVDTDKPNIVRIEPGDAELRHNQREQLSHVTLNGQSGHGDCTIIARGILPRLGLGTETLSW